MSMSRQDFVVIAHALRAQYDVPTPSVSRTRTVVVRGVANDLADAFEAKYPSFDRERFLAAVLRPSPRTSR